MINIVYLELDNSRGSCDLEDDLALPEPELTPAGA